MLSERDALIRRIFLLTTWIYYMDYVGAASGRSNFVTMRFPSQRVEMFGVRGNHRRPHRLGGMALDGVGFSYTLRYQPRFLLNKFGQQQESTEMPMPVTTPQPTEPEDPEPTIPIRTTSTADTPTEPPSPTPPQPTDPGMMMPTMEMPSSTEMMEMSSEQPPTKPTKPPKPTRPSTTRTTIMRPPQLFPHKFTHTLKQLLWGSPSQANLIQKYPNAPKTRGKGFLSLFEVIKFSNSKCSVSMGDVRSMEGVCYHEFECKSLGGIPTEGCADGVGVCCIFLAGCGDVTNQPTVYFESPNYPNAVREMMICVLMVNIREGVQQLRLDFQMFELSRPTNGDCIDDQFIVSGQNANFQIPILCGINTGQHIYVHVGDSSENKIYLSVFVKVSSGGRSFNVKISQLDSDLAPINCLQYFTEGEGIIKSFNYDTDGAIVENREATYFNNLNYAICLDRAKNVCGINYSTELLGGDQLDFQLINKDDNENDLVPDGQAGAGIFNCPDDYIAVNSVRLCGERLNDGIDSDDFTSHATVKDIAAGPIVLPFRTDAEYVGRGFRLLYRQELCV